MIKISHFIITGLLAVTLLTACGGSGETDPTNSADAEQASVGQLFNNREDRECPPLNDPVCADLDEEKQTFKNACEANKAGSKTWTRGECEG